MGARIRIVDVGYTNTVKRIQARDENNVLRLVTRVRIRNTANVLQTVYGALTVTISPSPVSGIVTVGGTANVPTSSVTVAVVGGTAPYTYSWAQVGVSAYVWVINSATSASTSFTAQAVEEGAYATNDFEVTVTDAANVTAKAVVNATARNKYDVVIERDSSGRFL